MKNLRGLKTQKYAPVGKALLFSMFLYLAACVTPALVALANGARSNSLIMIPGWWCLVMGSLFLGLGTGAFFSKPLSILSQYFLLGQFAVFANPILYLSWYFLFRQQAKAAFWLSALAILLALDTVALFWNSFPTDAGGASYAKLIYCHIGFYLWITSMLIVFVKACFSMKTSIKK
jgi:hypothetical protein